MRVFNRYLTFHEKVHYAMSDGVLHKKLPGFYSDLNMTYA